MLIRLQDGLPFVSATIQFRGNMLELDNILIDTGSAGTVLSADRLASVGVAIEPNDPIFRIHGIGGSEFVFLKRVELLQIGESQGGLWTRDFDIEVGAMDYGFAIDGIIGMDSLMAIGAIIDLGTLEMRAANQS